MNDLMDSPGGTPIDAAEWWPAVASAFEHQPSWSGTTNGASELLRRARLAATAGGDDLDRYLTDEHAYVRGIAYRNPATRPVQLHRALEAETDAGNQRILLTHPGIGAATLEMLLEQAGAANAQLTSQLAANPAMSPSRLRTLAQSDMGSVVAAVAANPAATSDILDAIFARIRSGDIPSHAEPQVLREAAGNPATPEHHLHWVRQERPECIHVWRHPAIGYQAVREAALGADGATAVRALQNPLCDAALLAEAFDAGRGDAAMLHPACPWDLISGVPARTAFRRHTPAVAAPVLPTPDAVRVAVELAGAGFAGTAGDLTGSAARLADD